MIVKNEQPREEKQFDATGGTSGMDISGLMNEVRAEDEACQDEYQDDDFIEGIEVKDPQLEY